MGESCCLCGSTEYNIISEKLRYDKPGTVVVCPSCGLARLLGIAAQVEKLNDFYAAQYAQEYHTGVKKDLDSLFESFLPVQAQRQEKISPFLKSSDRVLEVGSSTGYFLYSLRARVAEIQGLELNKQEAHYATAIRGVPTLDLPLEQSNLPHNYYDHICLFQVLEHAPNPMVFLQNLRPFLRTGGKIHIEVPNLLDPLVAFYDVADYRNFYYQEPHLYYFTPEVLAKICAAASYKLIKVSGFQQTSFINHLHWLFTRSPQPSRWDCMQARLPQGALQEDLPQAWKIDFQEILDNFNSVYLNFLEKIGLTDMIFCTLSI
jgi:2-polyprenyl-3-methyl-5-hydroxy-6-metoxy-1,4-benzoquinol methylase